MSSLSLQYFDYSSKGGPSSIRGLVASADIVPGDIILRYPLINVFTADDFSFDMADLEDIYEGLEEFSFKLFQEEFGSQGGAEIEEKKAQIFEFSCIVSLLLYYDIVRPETALQVLSDLHWEIKDIWDLPILNPEKKDYEPETVEFTMAKLEQFDLVYEIVGEHAEPLPSAT